MCIRDRFGPLMLAMSWLSDIIFSVTLFTVRLICSKNSSFIILTTSSSSSTIKIGKSPFSRPVGSNSHRISEVQSSYDFLLSHHIHHTGGLHGAELLTNNLISLSPWVPVDIITQALPTTLLAAADPPSEFLPRSLVLSLSPQHLSLIHI